MILGIPAETRHGEKRVAVTPSHIRGLKSTFGEIRVFKGAGAGASFADASYRNAGAVIIDQPADFYAGMDVLLRMKRSADDIEQQELGIMPSGLTMIGFLDPQVANLQHLQAYKQAGINACSFELMAQDEISDPMHATAAMSKLTGEVVVDEANQRVGLANKDVIVVGIGNAGLQAALAAAKLGARVHPITRSDRYRDTLAMGGAASLSIVDYKDDADFSKERRVIREMIEDVKPVLVVCAARVVGEKPPLLLDQDALSLLPDNALVYDLTASSGGNVSGNVYGQEIDFARGIKICSKTGYPKAKPAMASHAYGDAAASFLDSWKNLGGLDTSMAKHIVSTVAVLGGDAVRPSLVPQDGISQDQFNARAGLFVQRLAQRLRG